MEMKGEKTKIVIADDNAKLRSSIRKFLERSPNITVAGEASNGQEALALVERLKPDILVLDIHMPVLDGLAVMKMLRKRGCAAAMIVLSGVNDPFIVAEALTCGAHSYILKEDAPAHILGAIWSAVRGESGYISPQAAKSANSIKSMLAL